MRYSFYLAELAGKRTVPSHKLAEARLGFYMITFASPLSCLLFQPADQPALLSSPRLLSQIDLEEAHPVLKRNPGQSKTVELDEISSPQKMGEPEGIAPRPIVVQIKEGDFIAVAMGQDVGRDQIAVDKAHLMETANLHGQLPKVSPLRSQGVQIRRRGVALL